MKIKLNRGDERLRIIIGCNLSLDELRREREKEKDHRESNSS